MRFAHLLTQFYFEPWHLRPDKHAAFGRLLQEHLQGQDIQSVHSMQAAPFQAGRPIVGPVDRWGNPMVPQMTVEQGVAIIPIWGVLGKRLPMLNLMCGGCDYDNVTAFAQLAMADDSIRSVILDFDSPGGQARGIPECAAVLAQLAEVKPVISYTDTCCASAAYRLAIEAGEIYAAPSSTLGSIGTIIAALDNSREWEMKGWVLELFASGALKAVGCEGKRWSDNERQFLRGQMERKQAQFVSSMNTRRPAVAAESMEGQWFDGDEAVGLGLADGTANTLAEVVASLVLVGR